MSVYNGMPYLPAAMDSLMAQSFGDFELVVVNDGSKDDSEAVLRRYAEADPRVRLISRSNKGLIASLNEAAAASRAPLLARMDADDVCHPNRFARQVQAMQARPDVVALGTWMRLIDSAGRVTLPPGQPPVGAAGMQRAFRRGTGFIGHPTLMMRRQAFEAVGRYRSAYRHAEDLDLFYRLTFVGTVDNLPEHLLDYRTHGENVSVRHGYEMQMMGSLIVVLNRIRAEEGLDLSGRANEPPDLRTMDQVFGCPGLADAVTDRMMHEYYVGSELALRGVALEHTMTSLAKMRRAPDAARRRRALSLGWRSTKGLIRLRAWKDLVRFVRAVYM
jgi:glycosyltransferase involved in cell wall biosynthesis